MAKKIITGGTSETSGLGYFLTKLWAKITSKLNDKVDKVSGKGLSTNDYTAADKNKLSGISAGAEVNVQSDWNVTDAASDAFIKNKPTIGNGTVTIKQKGVSKGSFTLNQSGNATIELTDDNTTYGVATSSTPGLVKSGTDITVDANGNVSVNDDSHNHVISNVDGLQTALDGKQASGYYVSCKLFNSSIETTYTIDSLWAELSPITGCTGSVYLGKKASGVGSGIVEGWYNYLYMPHGTGVDGGDNAKYGSILLTPMVVDTASWVLRVTNSSTAVTAVYKFTKLSISDTSGTVPVNRGGTGKTTASEALTNLASSATPSTESSWQDTQLLLASAGVGEWSGVRSKTALSLWTYIKSKISTVCGNIFIPTTGSANITFEEPGFKDGFRLYAYTNGSNNDNYLDIQGQVGDGTNTSAATGYNSIVRYFPKSKQATFYGRVVMNSSAYTNGAHQLYQGSFTHGGLQGTDATGGYIHFCTITVNTSYANEPFYMTISSRNRLGKLKIHLGLGNTTTIFSPLLVWEPDYFSNTDAYLTLPVWYKYSSNVLYLYWSKSEAYDSMTVTDLVIGSYMRSHLTIAWNNSLVSSNSGLTQVTSRGGVFDESGNSISGAYLKLAGGTMTGAITTAQNQYNGAYAINLRNSDIINVNAIKAANTAESAGEGYLLKRSDGKWDSIWAANGTMYFSTGGTEATDGTYTWAANNTVLHSGNYSSYAAPTSHTHGLLLNSFYKLLDNTATDSGFTMFDGTGNCNIFRVLRSQANAPAWMQPGYSAGIVFGGGDTKGCISMRYQSASVRFAGGNGTAFDWWMTITGTHNTSYNLNNYASKTQLTDGSVTKVGTATVGSSTKPIYLSSGVPTAGSTYAGGSRVMLNNTTYTGSTATFYAPTDVVMSNFDTGTGFQSEVNKDYYGAIVIANGRYSAPVFCARLKYHAESKQRNYFKITAGLQLKARTGVSGTYNPDSHGAGPFMVPSDLTFPTSTEATKNDMVRDMVVFVTGLKGRKITIDEIDGENDFDMDYPVTTNGVLTSQGFFKYTRNTYTFRRVGTTTLISRGGAGVVAWVISDHSVFESCIDIGTSYGSYGTVTVTSTSTSNSVTTTYRAVDFTFPRETHVMLHNIGELSYGGKDHVFDSIRSISFTGGAPYNGYEFTIICTATSTNANTRLSHSSTVTNSIVNHGSNWGFSVIRLVYYGGKWYSDSY